jgi:hypothetical protein
MIKIKERTKEIPVEVQKIWRLPVVSSPCNCEEDETLKLEQEARRWTEISRAIQKRLVNPKDSVHKMVLAESLRAINALVEYLNARAVERRGDVDPWREY